MMFLVGMIQQFGALFIGLAQAAGGTVYEPNSLHRIAAGIAIGAGAIGPGIGIGIAVGGAVQAIGRNPEATGEIRTTMIIGAALSEAVAIYALVIALILAFT